MHKKTLLFGLLIGLAMGGGSVLTYSQVFQRPPVPQSEEAITLPTSQPQVAIAGDVDSGDGLTPVQMFDELNSTTSADEFDRKFMTYMVLLKNNENGMARMVAQKTTRAELQELATAITTTNAPDIAAMLKWQRLWGFTDH